VGWGFRPWRGGGLITYAEDVMRGQVRAGHEVAWFCAARDFPGLRRPRLVRWRRGGVEIHEVLNSPVLVAADTGTRDPEGGLSDPRLERMFGRVLARTRPEVVHVHELAALPSSLLDVVRRAGIPTVMTLQDYGLLCPTIKLFDADGARCRRMRPGTMCRTCCAQAPVDAHEARGMTRNYERRRLARRLPLVLAALDTRRAVKRGIAARRPGAADGTGGGGAHGEVETASAFPSPPPAAAYDHRREVNVARLERVDALVAMSEGVAEIYAELGVGRDRLRVLHLTLEHLQHLVPRRLEAAPRRVRFMTLSGAIDRAKGAEALAEAVAGLAARGLGASYELTVHGPVHPSVRGELERHPAVALRGPYDARSLDAMLDEADVGIVPSVWDEAYGYVGVEFLAKGVPVIGTARGGIPAYAIPGETGWLNRSATGAELAGIMADVIRRPQQVLELNERVLERRGALVKPMSRHLAELEAMYRSLVAAPRPVGAAAGARSGA